MLGTFLLHTKPETVVVVLSSTHLLQMVGLFELEMIAQKVICVRERM